MRKTFFCFCVIFLSLNPAIAGWQNTEWNMSIEEFQMLSTDFKYTTKNNNTGSVEITYPYFVDDIEMEASLFFEGLPNSEILSRVNLSIADPKDCLSVLGLLRATYGAPESEESTSDGLMSIWQWRDTNNENLLNYLAVGVQLSPVSCLVIYQPLPISNNSGGL